MTQVLSTIEEMTKLADKLLNLNRADRNWTLDDEVMHIQIHGKRTAWGEAEWRSAHKRLAEYEARRPSELRTGLIRVVNETIEKLKVQYACDF